MRILIKAAVVCFALSAIVVVWLMIDDTLDKETRRWLEPPPAPASAALDAATHIRALAGAAEDEGISRSDLDPDHRCAQLDEQCAHYVAQHRTQIMAALPSNEAYWDAYQGVLRSQGLSAELERLTVHQWQPYIAALKFSVIRELATFGTLRPEFMAATVNAQRRLLAESPFLVDKMIFAATTAMSFRATKLALQTTPPDDEGFGALQQALRPLSPAEISLRRVMGGELRNMESQLQVAGVWSRLFFKRRHLLNLQRRMLAPVVEETEMAGVEFWGRRAHRPWQPTWWDILFDPIGSRLAGIAAPAYAGYSVSLQILDVQATALRARAAALSGEDFPSPGTTPESLAHWVWRQDGESLCLMPTAEAPRAPEVGPVCL
jgi:hypothetical protein